MYGINGQGLASNARPESRMTGFGRERQLENIPAFDPSNITREAGLAEQARQIAPPRQTQPEQPRQTLPRGRLTGPVRFAILVMESWHLSPVEMTSLLGYELTDEGYVRDVLNGVVTLRGRDSKDRIVCLYTLHSLLTGLFRDDNSINEWLRQAQPLLDQQTPLQILLEGSMESMLRVRYLVEYITGR